MAVLLTATDLKKWACSKSYRQQAVPSSSKQQWHSRAVVQGNNRRSRQEWSVCRTTSEQKELLSFCLCAVRWWVWVLVSGWSIVGAGFLVLGLLLTVPASAKPTNATKHDATSDAAAAPGSKLPPAHLVLIIYGFV